MAYRFKRKESVSDAIRRLGCERIEDALACLKEPTRAAAIHGARKDIKKVRAVARLARGGVRGKDFHRLAGILREAASQLAAPRDAYIKTQTLRKLTHDFRGRLTPGAVRPIRARLRGDFRKEMKCFAEADGSHAIEKALRRAAKALQDLEFDDKGWQAIGSGVKTAYREGRLAYRKAREAPSPGNFHEWRKRVKDLWYHVRLLCPVWPEQMHEMVTELETLGEALGDDHDLAVLRQDLDSGRFGDGNARGVKALSDAMERRQRQLRRAALALGVRFYAEKPSVFCDRLAGYWKIWRHEKPAKKNRSGAHPV